MCKIILKSIHKCTSYGPDKLNILPFWPLFDPCDLDLQPNWKKCFKRHFFSSRTTTVQNYFFQNPCINVHIMARTKSIYDHFDLYLTPVTLIYIYLPEKMFQLTFFLFEDNNCAKLFWNPYINVQVMARTSSIYDHFDRYLTTVTLTFNLPEKMFQMALFLLEGNNCAKIILKSMHKCTSYGPDKLFWPFWHLFDPYDLDLQPT